MDDYPSISWLQFLIGQPPEHFSLLVSTYAHVGMLTLSALWTVLNAPALEGLNKFGQGG